MATSGNWHNEASYPVTNMHMFENEILTDVVIKAGDLEQEFKVHKFILASRSPVFYTMFCGSFSETAGVVAIPDIEPRIMKTLLRFLYSGTCDILGECVMALLYAAKKYELPILVDRCKEFLKKNISTETVCVILDQAHSFGEGDLKRDCMRYALYNAHTVLNTDGFLSLSKEILAEMMKSDLLKCNELQLYNACKSWAKRKSERTSENVTHIMREIVNLIRFPTMDAKKFTEQVSKEDFLTDSEKLNILQDIILGEGMSEFNNQLREPLQFCVSRFGSISPSTLSHNGSKSSGAITFKVSKAVKLLGVGQYLPTSEGKLSGELEIYEDFAAIRRETVSLNFDKDKKEKYVKLQAGAINLKPNALYTICQRLKGVPTYKGKSVTKKHTMHGIDIHFSFSPSSSDSTNSVFGHFPGLLLQLEWNYNFKMLWHSM